METDYVDTLVYKDTILSSKADYIIRLDSKEREWKKGTIFLI